MSDLEKLEERLRTEFCSELVLVRSDFRGQFTRLKWVLVALVICLLHLITR